MKKTAVILLVLLMMLCCASAYARSDDGNFGDIGTVAPAVTPFAYLNEGNGWVRTQQDLLTNFYSCTSPETVYVPDYDVEGGYPYRMFFYGWAFTQSNDPTTGYKGYPGGDAIFHARAKTLEGPWEVYSRTEGTEDYFWDTEMNPKVWCPVVVCQDNWYDSWHVADASVVYKDGTFYLAYSSQGCDEDLIWGLSEGDTDGFSHCTMAATSKDGITWTRSKAPIMIWEGEKGYKDNESGQWAIEGYYGSLGQPSILFEDDKWKCWFMYNSGKEGAKIGYSENSGDFLNPDDWKMIRFLDNPTNMKGTTDFDVVKLGDTYFAYGNTWLIYQGIEADFLSNYPLDGWKSWGNNICEYRSKDGLNWEFTGYFLPDDDTMGAICPQVIIDEKNERLCVFYCTQRGYNENRFNYDWRWDNIRMMYLPYSAISEGYKVLEKPTARIFPTPTPRVTATPRPSSTPTPEVTPTEAPTASLPSGTVPENASAAPYIAAASFAVLCAVVIIFIIKRKPKN